MCGCPQMNETYGGIVCGLPMCMRVSDAFKNKIETNERGTARNDSVCKYTVVVVVNCENACETATARQKERVRAVGLWAYRANAKREREKKRQLYFHTTTECIRIAYLVQALARASACECGGNCAKMMIN